MGESEIEQGLMSNAAAIALVVAAGLGNVISANVHIQIGTLAANTSTAFVQTGS